MRRRCEGPQFCGRATPQQQEFRPASVPTIREQDASGPTRYHRLQSTTSTLTAALHASESNQNVEFVESTIASPFFCIVVVVLAFFARCRNQSAQNMKYPAHATVVEFLNEIDDACGMTARCESTMLDLNGAWQKSGLAFDKRKIRTKRSERLGVIAKLGKDLQCRLLTSSVRGPKVVTPPTQGASWHVQQYLLGRCAGTEVCHQSPDNFGSVKSLCQKPSNLSEAL